MLHVYPEAFCFFSVGDLIPFFWPFLHFGIVSFSSSNLLFDGVGDPREGV